jgi:hypothetical protein
MRQVSGGVHRSEFKWVRFGVRFDMRETANMLISLLSGILAENQMIDPSLFNP